MTSTLVDSNVVIDVMADAGLSHWSSRKIAQAADLGVVVINPIILAEVSAGFDDLAAVDAALRRLELERETFPWEAAYLAGRAHVTYRREGGQRERTLPDFLIGAHASVRRYRLLTRDPRRYRAYFPNLELVAPDTHP